MGRRKKGDPEKVFEYVELNDQTTIQKLGWIDQLRTALQTWLRDDGADLDRNSKLVNAELQTLKADLRRLFRKATRALKEGRRHDVMLEVPSVFSPVLYEVLGMKEFSAYYDVIVKRPELDYDIPFNYTIIITVKEVIEQ